MRKTLLREDGNRWCELDVRLENGRLSITGTEGAVLTPPRARQRALEFWESFFEDSPEELKAMNLRFDRRFRSPRGAARFVLHSDGEYHGLDVRREDEGKVYTAESCGQIRDELRRWFPEVEPYLSWHLNDMHAGCEHQEALGWRRGKTIALTDDTLTPAQRTELEAIEAARVARLREKAYAERWANLRAYKSAAISWIRSHRGGDATVTLHDLGVLGAPKGAYLDPGARQTLRTFDRWMREDLEREIPAQPFVAAIYKDCIGAPCPECGYRYGTEWLRRELPSEVVAWVESL